MGLRLRIVAGPDEGKEFFLNAGENFQIGRGVDTQTKLHDPRVSRNHCSIVVRDAEATIVDAGSTGGTFVNGQRITERQLKSGDIIRVGGTQMQFVGNNDDTLNWANRNANRPCTDLMETREMKRVEVDPESTAKLVAPPADDDETLRGDPRT